MRNTLVCALVWILAMPLQGRELTVQQQAQKVQIGQKIEVTLQSNETLKGRRGTLSGTGFSLEPLKADQGTARTLEFQEVKRVRRTGLNTIEKVAIISAIAIGALAVTVYALAKASGC
jgi:hypothetical protein